MLKLYAFILIFNLCQKKCVDIPNVYMYIHVNAHLISLKQNVKNK